MTNNLYERHASERASEYAGEQACECAGRRVDEHAGRRVDERASRQTGKQTGRRVSKLISTSTAFAMAVSLNPVAAFAQARTQLSDAQSVWEQNVAANSGATADANAADTTAVDAEAATGTESAADAEATDTTATETAVDTATETAVDTATETAADSDAQTSSTSSITEEDISEVLAELDACVSNSLANSDASAEGNITLSADIESALFTSSKEGVVSDSVVQLAGDSRIDTAIKEAKYAYPNGASTVIIAGSSSWVDALSATGLAGAIDAPILFTEQDALNSETKSALEELGAKRVIILGGTPSVSDSAKNEIAALSGVSVERISGSNRFETQAAIYDYGASGYDGTNHWSRDTIIITRGNSFPDALSISPMAYVSKSPIFSVDSDGQFTASTMKKLATIQSDSNQSFSRALLLGDENSVSVRTKGFVRALLQKAESATTEPVRLGGSNRYATSALIAQYCVDEGYLSWDKAAFTTGERPYDALAGSVVQGKDKSVLLLANSASSDAVNSLVSHKASVSMIKFFGNTDAIALKDQFKIAFKLGLIDNVVERDTGISLDAMANLETSASVGYHNYSKSEILEYLNPENFDYDTEGFYQFANVGMGYSGEVSASELDAFISSVSGDDKGADGMLAGRGASFIQAAQTYGVNEVYLLSHAILESGWGSSELSKGYYFSGGTIDDTYYPAGTYYNFFGIGAYDSSPLSGGRKKAIIEGWNSPEAAIMGAAEWIANNYTLNKYSQNTLYKMKWNYNQAASESTVWKQYATSKDWAYGISRLMSQCYARNNISIENTGLIFEIPQYS